MERTRKTLPPLIIDKVSDQSNLLFLSLIEYKRHEYLGIIDDITDSHLKAYVIELNKPSVYPVNEFLSHSIRWFYSQSFNYPLSFFLSENGLTPNLTHMYKIFELNGISRVLGNPFMFKDLNESSSKKRKVLPIPEGIEIRFKKADQK